MDFAQKEILLAGAAVLIYLVIIASIPLRVRFILKKAGKILVPVLEKKVLLQYVTIVISGFLIVILFFRELGFVYDCIICLVSILGCAMSSEEICLNKKCGLYQNGLIANGHFLPLEEIYALPVLSYEKEVQDSMDPRILVITTNRQGTVNYVFSSAEEKLQVQNGILKLKPGLER